MAQRPFTHGSFQQYLEEGRLMASRDRVTDEIFLPPRPLNPATYGDDMEWVELSGEGKLVAFTAIHIGVEAMLKAGYDRQNPYCTGIVELEEGPKISAQIMGVNPSRPDEIQIGAPLRVSFVERGEGEEKRTMLAFEAVG